MSFARVRGLLLRYYYCYSRSTFRVLDIVFWPVMDLLVWGFLTMYMLKVNGAVPGVFTFLIGSVIMWNVLYRAQQAVSVSFLEDVWSRNFINIFVAPVRTSEFVAATCISGLLQSVCVSLIMIPLAYWFYQYNFGMLGYCMIPFFINLLLMGWTIGLITTAIIIRWGHQAEALAWAIPFLIQPICCVFYPVDVLPAWLRAISLCVPATYVFEGMRTVLKGGSFSSKDLLMSVALNLIYALLAALLFEFLFNEARKNGKLTKMNT